MKTGRNSNNVNIGNDDDVNVPQIHYFYITRIPCNTCLRNMCKIFLPKTIYSKDIHNLTLQRDITAEIKKRRWKWIDHALRKEKHDITKIALRWILTEGKRDRTTWHCSVESELRRIMRMTKGAQNDRHKTGNSGGRCSGVMCKYMRKEDRLSKLVPSWENIYSA